LSAGPRDPAVAGLDEVYSELAIRPISIDACWERRGSEVIEWCEESQSGAIIGDQVLQQEVPHVSLEVPEQPKEVPVPRECIT